MIEVPGDQGGSDGKDLTFLVVNHVILIMSSACTVVGSWVIRVNILIISGRDTKESK